MPSFDVVSEVDLHEVRNGVDQANREVGQRYDFKGSSARFELSDDQITLHGQTDFQLQQMLEMLDMKLAKRGVDIGCLERRPPEIGAKTARQTVLLKQGIETEIARRMVKDIKTSKTKVQAQIQGDQLRVTGKKRDDLQQVIGLLKEGDYGLPLQFTNFRD
jgi:uncharacterized protein YajQ (UPF0234 family)